MTDPAAQLAACRAGLDRLEQLAKAATPGPWEASFNVHCDPFVDQTGRGPFGRIASVGVSPADYGRANAEFIGACSPSWVLAVCAGLRQTLDGAEETWKRHYELRAVPEHCAICQYMAWPCPDHNAAVSVIAGLAAVLAEQAVK